MGRKLLKVENPGTNNPNLHTALLAAACRWQEYLCNETDRKRGIGFIGYYLEGRRELHTGHSSWPATWSEAQRQLVERRHKPSAASTYIIHVRVLPPLSLSHT